MTKQIISFVEFKNTWSLTGDNEDYFIYSANIGCTEPDFEKWLKSKKTIAINHPQALNQPLREITLSTDKWHILTEWFERDTLVSFLTNQYPEGFFEAVREDGEVAALLPDTYGKAKYRISYYQKTGPTYHETFVSRIDALKALAQQKFRAQPGALDDIVGTKMWNRGLFVCKWISEGLNTTEGILRDGDIPEVKHLFSLPPAIA